MEKGIYFVSGIDTDAGKSYMTGMLAKVLKDKNINVITHKFIQTGGDIVDIKTHREIMNLPLLQEDIDRTTCPLVYTYPCSPHLAAEIDGVVVDLNVVEKSLETLKNNYDIVLTEGAGGLNVPISGIYTTLDYLEEKKLPLIFVSSGKLGSINHTFNSLEVCRRRGIELHTFVYNTYFDTDKIISEDTQKVFKQYLDKHHPNARYLKL